MPFYQVDSSRLLQTPEDVYARPCSCRRIVASSIRHPASCTRAPKLCGGLRLRVPRAYSPERPGRLDALFVSSRPRVADSLTWPAGEHPLEIRARSRGPTVRRHLSPPRAPRAAGPGRRGRSRGPPVPIPSLPLAMSRRSPNFPTAATADGRVAAFRRARATPPAPAQRFHRARDRDATR